MKTNRKRLRIIVAAVLLFAGVALAHTGGAADGVLAWGTLCALCPVGFAQIAVAAKAVPWHLLPGVLAVLVIVFLVGRAFCSWACPSQLLKNIFGGHSPRGLRGRSGTAPAKGEDALAADGAATGDGIATASAAAPAKKASGCSHGCATCHEGGTQNYLGQGILLAMLLVVSFAVGFPVFCLLCPIGLVFGTLWAVNRVFTLLQPGWELIIFPLMLLAELFLFKRWCTALCPLGFIFGLLGKLRAKLGFGLRPVADCSICISKDGCRTCSTACPEDIDVARDGNRETLEACTMCLDCVENCPTKSIKLKASEPKK